MAVHINSYQADGEMGRIGRPHRTALQARNDASERQDDRRKWRSLPVETQAVLLRSLAALLIEQPNRGPHRLARIDY